MGLRCLQLWGHEEEEAGARVPEEGSQTPGERGWGVPPPLGQAVPGYPS